MSGLILPKVGWGLVLSGILVGAGCIESPSQLEPLLSSSPSGSREVIAKVGGVPLRVGDLPLFASWSAELQKQHELTLSAASGFERKLNLALDLLALSVETEKHGTDPVWIEDQKKRLLVRAYLDRRFGNLDQLPVPEEALQAAHQEEMEKFYTIGESDLYRPTTLDAAAIMVGYFPDFHPPQEEEPVLKAEAVKELAQKIRNACGQRVYDLDEFLALARSFMSGHPTVQVKEYLKLPMQPDETRLDTDFHRAILSLGSNGEVGDPVWVSGGAFIVRRGITRPGKGEKVAAITKELIDKVRLQRKRDAYKKHMNRLRQSYQVRSWPEKIRQNAMDEDPAK